MIVIGAAVFIMMAVTLTCYFCRKSKLQRKVIEEQTEMKKQTEKEDSNNQVQEEIHFQEHHQTDADIIYKRSKKARLEIAK